MHLFKLINRKAVALNDKTIDSRVLLEDNRLKELENTSSFSFSNFAMFKL